MSQTYHPLGNRILIRKQVAEEQKTPSGIITSMDKPDVETSTIGKIITIASKVDKTLDLKEGQMIKFAKHSQVDLGNQMALVKDIDIQAIIYEKEDENETK